MNDKVTKWRKSSRSASNGQCVETRAYHGHMQVRDSKLGDASPILSMETSDFASLLNEVKNA